MKLERLSIPVPTDAGAFLAHYSACGLAGLDFPSEKRPHRPAAATNKPPTPLLSRWHELTVRALKRALMGKATVDMPPLDLSAGTLFRRKVWSELRNIPLGRTKAYAQIAAAIKAPKAVRAVGSACGANPIPILIPCHRVLRTNGQLGGFSAGLKWKRLLLARERAKDWQRS